MGADHGKGKRLHISIIPPGSPVGDGLPRGRPGLDRQHLKATWETAAGFEVHPVPVGQAGEFPSW